MARNQLRKDPPSQICRMIDCESRSQSLAVGLKTIPALPGQWLVSGLVYDVATGLVEVVVPQRRFMRRSRR
jgi:hypothetical protein